MELEILATYVRREQEVRFRSPRLAALLELDRSAARLASTLQVAEPLAAPLAAAAR